MSEDIKGLIEEVRATHKEIAELRTELAALRAELATLRLRSLPRGPYGPVPYPEPLDPNEYDYTRISPYQPPYRRQWTEPYIGDHPSWQTQGPTCVQGTGGAGNRC